MRTNYYQKKAQYVIQNKHVYTKVNVKPPNIFRHRKQLKPAWEFELQLLKWY